MHGSTDPCILADAFSLAGVPEEVYRPRMEWALEQMRTEVLAGRARMLTEMLPGVRELLERLRGERRVLGVATGNLEAIGWLKVELCGLRDYFTFGGFSDRHRTRAAMIAEAADLAREQAGAHARLLVIGDTPGDIEAARANHLDVMAVATGIFSEEELLAANPDFCARDLTGFAGAPRLLHL